MTKTGLLIALFLGMAGTYSSTYGLTNPMRPPSGYLVPGLVETAVAEATADWVLQSVILGQDRSAAIIDGVAVSRGESYRRAKLISVKTAEVVLQMQNGKKIVLKLIPGIHKKKRSVATEISQK